MRDDRATAPPGDDDEPLAEEITRRVERIAFLAGELDQAVADLAAARKAEARAAQALERLRRRWWVRLGSRIGRVLAALRSRAAPAGGVGSGDGEAAPGAGMEAAVPRSGARDRIEVVGKDRPEGRAGDALDRLRAGLRSPHSVRLRVGLWAGDGGTAAALAASLEQAGPELVRLSGLAGADGLDAAVVADPGLDIRDLPEGLPTIAFAVDGTLWQGAEWFDEFDLVAALGTGEALPAVGTVHVPLVVPSLPEAGPGILGALRSWADRRRIDIAISAPDWSAAPRWGDHHFARALQRALQARGHPARIRLRDRWSTPGAARADIVIHLAGLHRRPVIAGQTTILWIISHPDLITDAQVHEADLVFAASSSFADALSERTGRTVAPLLQATDPDRFRPTPGGPAHDLLFVANSRRHRRPIVEELTPTAMDLAVYGHGWTPRLLDPRHLAGGFVPNDRLPAYYSSAAIVLNDHWADMAQHGFLSNRLFDAAACGAFILSDRVPGLDEVFDGGIPGYRDGAELRRLVRRFLADPGVRREHAERSRAATVADHTFAARAASIEEALGPVLRP